MQKPQRVEILGVKFDDVTMNNALDFVKQMINDTQKHYIVTPNPEFVIKAQKDNSFLTILNNADLAIPDGIGILAAAKYLSKNFSSIPRPIRIFLSPIYGLLYVGFSTAFKQKNLDTLAERVTGTDLMINLCKLASQKGWSVYLLGGENGAVQQTRRVLTESFPNLHISGSSEQDPYLTTDKYQIPPSDLLFVAYGAPTQEKWITKHLNNLPVKVAMGVGGAFDFITGKQKRAPLFIQKLGLEWFWRLITQPKYRTGGTKKWRWKRQLAIIKFVYLVAIEGMKTKEKTG
ncbi:WecB/TagA/CpsF family glycosyltransferase [Patescibacteria group bacterium]|nr:WecB/TagA/CpsF family glycosyltransferase [Patescibacteria group bacterium]